MAISNPRYAAELITSSEVLKFDDFGCMISHERKIDERIVAAYVKDYETMAWVAREEASYVHSKEIPTPMGFGIVAVADGKRAETLAAKVSGRVIDLGEARELVDKP
jgi:copper chaperone NosL